MKKNLLFLVSICSLGLLAACGGAGGSGGPSFGAATHFSVSAPPNTTAGTQFQFTVTALDASNNIVASYTGTVQFTSTDGQAALPANSALPNGTSQFRAYTSSAPTKGTTASPIAFSGFVLGAAAICPSEGRWTERS